MEHMRRVLEQVMAGNQVGKGLWDLAMAECDAAEARDKAVGEIAVMRSPEVDLRDEAILTLGELFFVLEDFITEMNKAGHIETLRSDVVSTMIDAKQVLIRAKFEGIRTRAPGPITGPTRGRRAR